jgi:recyclin-1
VKSGTAGAATTQASAPTFLTASNPDQVKRNVLAGFRDVLLLPVTIVPRTVTFGVNAIVTGGTQAVNGLAMLNPQKWAGSNGRSQVQAVKQGNTEVLVDVPVVEDKGDQELRSNDTEKDGFGGSSEEINEKVTDLQLGSTTIEKVEGSTQATAFDSLQLLISLDIALELIHADRDSLKRAETFAGYPGKYGHKVREALEEIFILMLKAASDRHIAPGFKK